MNEKDEALYAKLVSILALFISQRAMASEKSKLTEEEPEHSNASLLGSASSNNELAIARSNEALMSKNGSSAVNNPIPTFAALFAKAYENVEAAERLPIATLVADCAEFFDECINQLFILSTSPSASASQKRSETVSCFLQCILYRFYSSWFL